MYLPLTLPQLWESKWDVPTEIRHGLPKFPTPLREATDLWQWLALLGGAGLLTEWLLFGRLRRGRTPCCLSKQPLPMRKAS